MNWKLYNLRAERLLARWAKKSDFKHCMNWAKHWWPRQWRTTKTIQTKKDMEVFVDGIINHQEPNTDLKNAVEQYNQTFVQKFKPHVYALVAMKVLGPSTSDVLLEYLTSFGQVYQKEVFEETLNWLEPEFIYKNEIEPDVYIYWLNPYGEHMLMHVQKTLRSHNRQ